MNISKKGTLFYFLLILQIILSGHINANVKNTEEYYTEAELAQILAPIALYPDSLLTHIVIASTYPLEIVQAHRWREDNSHLDPQSAVELAEAQGWDPSVTALVAFPNVLERLSADLNWTQSLGEAFLLNEEAVLDSIQALRVKAEKANSLNEMENVRVIKVERQIIIEPAHREIVYVPYYDTRVVYGHWRWHRNPPVYWDLRPNVSISFSNRFSPSFHWSPGIHINFNYFFGAFKWHKRHIVVTHHHDTRHYRSHQRISVSHGAKRWQHNNIHRRGVVYKKHQLNTRFVNPNKIHKNANNQRHHSFKNTLIQHRNSQNYKNDKQDRKIYRNHSALEKRQYQQKFNREKRDDGDYLERRKDFNTRYPVKDTKKYGENIKRFNPNPSTKKIVKNREKEEIQSTRKHEIVRDTKPRVKEK